MKTFRDKQLAVVFARRAIQQAATLLLGPGIEEPLQARQRRLLEAAGFLLSIVAANVRGRPIKADIQDLYVVGRSIAKTIRELEAKDAAIRAETKHVG